VSTALVLSVGILVADVFVPPLGRLPAAGELVATDDFMIQPGGCAANVALALGKLGVSAAVCGRVGDDVFGDLVERELRVRGIETSRVLRTPEHGTSKTVIVPVIGEDRRFVHTFGANAALTAADLDAAALDAADVIYLGGYLILPGLREEELVPRLLDARASGAIIVLDVAVPSGDDAALPGVATLLPLAHYFVPNVDEARALTGELDPPRQAERLLEQGAQTLLIKLGARGVYVRSREREFELAAPPVSVVEPSGAGDAFAAGLIVGILERWGLERAAQFASVVGASACTALGCCAGVFTRVQAEAFLAEHPLPARTVAGA
jgi:sugar/nucleoside kinase (ribokinase family)